MARLPQPGGDDGTWGNVLNDFLSQAHNADGSLKDGSVGAGTLQSGAVTKAAVGLSNVDNTSDANKPVSAAAQAALDAKVAKGDLVVNVRDYGAKGDGTTDDTAAINASFMAASSVGRSTVFFPAGTYLFSSILQNISNVMVTGRGARLVSTLNKTDNTVAFNLIGNHITVEDLVFDYQTPLNVDSDAATRPSGAHTIAFGPAHTDGNTYTNLIIRNCEIYNSRNSPIAVRYGQHVRIDGNYMAEALGNGIVCASCTNDVRITNNDINRTGDDGIALLGETSVNPVCKRVFVSNNTVYQTYANGIDFTGVNGGHIVNNQIDTTWANGIFVWEDTTDALGPSSNVIIQGNHVTATGTYYGTGQFKTTAPTVAEGVHITGSNQTGIIVASNNIYSIGKRGILVENSSQANVTGNNITSSGTHGLEVDNTTAGIIALNRVAMSQNSGFVLTGTESPLLFGNVAYNNAVAADGTSDNFTFSGGARHTVTGNKAIDDRATALIDVSYDAGSIGAGPVHWSANSYYIPNATSKRTRYGANNIGQWNLDQDEGWLSISQGASWDTQQAQFILITVSNSSAFTIPNPATRIINRQMTIVLYNNSGGGMGNVTWGTDFLLDSSAPNGASNLPANGKRRTIKFVGNGTNWIQIGAASGDQ